MRKFAVLFAFLSVYSATAIAEDLFVGFDKSQTNGYTFKTNTVVAGIDPDNRPYLAVIIENVAKKGEAVSAPAFNANTLDFFSQICEDIFGKGPLANSYKVSSVPNHNKLSPGQVGCAFQQQ